MCPDTTPGIPKPGGREYLAVRDILLVWVMDASLSMKDDQADVRERLWETRYMFREQTRGGVLKQAVVCFGDRPQLWLGPTTDVDLVAKAMEAIEPYPPGTRENVMAALSFVAGRFSGESGFKKKVAVLVDDDNADDTLALEKAIRDLKAARMTLYVINRECPFQGTVTYESYEYVDKDGDKYRGAGHVDRGPDTADPEVASVGWGGFFDPNRVVSAFGIYDVTRIALSTGGRYFILGEAKADCDWGLMESYAPGMESREEYRQRTAKNPFRIWTEKTTTAWNRGSPSGGHYPWSALGEESARCMAKLEQADELIQRMKRNAVMPAAELAKLKTLRRWPANADLTWFSLLLARHRVRQYAYAIEEFRASTSSIPENHHIYVDAHQKLRETPEELKDRQEIIEALRFLDGRHPRTPWGIVLSQVDPASVEYLYGFHLTHGPYFSPYSAVLEFETGLSVKGVVVGEDLVKGTYTVHVAGKGQRVIARDVIRKVTKIADVPPPAPERI